MRNMHKVVAALLAAALFTTSDSAQAQLLKNGGIGSRLGVGRNAAANLDPAAMDALNGEIVVEEAPAAPSSLGVTRSATLATPAAQAAAQPGAAATTAQAPLKKSDGSEFVIPANATIAQLIEQADKLMETEFAFETEEEFNDWVQKMLATVGKIGDSILKLKPSDEEFVKAISLKGQALCYQASIDSSVLPKLGSYAAALEKNARVQGLEEGKQAALAFRGVYLQAKVADIAERDGTAAELTAAMKEVAAFIEEHPETSDMTIDLVFPVAFVAESQKQPKLPAQIWTPIRKQLAASKAPEAKAALQLLEGTLRYSELEGNEFEWHGLDADGNALDPKAVKGKVVLVDFWAAWSESCAAVHTQLKELYEKYHDAGFEIVGYDLDAEKDQMNEYLTKNSIPWIILSDRATVDAKETSLAAYYGVTEIPTMILIGGDGKVAALDISMESLVATLESVFAQAAAVQAGSATTNAAAGSATTGKAATAKSGAAATKAAGSATTKAAGATATKSTGATTKPATGASKSTGTTVSPARKSNAPTTIRSTKK